MFNQRLIYLRKQKKLTQSDLANKLGFTRGQLSNYELGQREPNFKTLIQIADFFNVSIDYLIGRNDESNLKLLKNSSHEFLYDLDEVVDNEAIRFSVCGQTLDKVDDKMIRDMLKIATSRIKRT